jgi:hypothetical protein
MESLMVIGNEASGECVEAIDIAWRLNNKRLGVAVGGTCVLVGVAVG